MTGSTVLLDGDGRAVVEVAGFRARIVGGEQQLRQRLGNRWLHELTWPREDLADSEQIDPGWWLILGDRGDLAKEIAEGLVQAGHTAVLARPGTRFSAVGPDEFVMRPGERSDVEQLVRDVAGRTDQPVRVIYLSPARLDTGEAMPQLVSEGLIPLLHLVQALDADGLAWPLTVVTAGAVPVDARIAPAGLAQAPLWGMGRVLHQESLALRSRLLDMDPTRPAGDIAALLAELLTTSPSEDQVAWRDGGRHVARLQPSQHDTGSVPFPLRPDASYLITGGLGSLGLLVARRLAERGARHILLADRFPLPVRGTWPALAADDTLRRVTDAVERIEELGATVETATVDVADPVALNAFLARRDAQGRPALRGIIHAAGSVQDQVMVKMTESALEDVLRAKVGGAWSLHQAFADRPLDAFVLFSSVSSVVVTAGQANYAAGNAFLDALAYHRRGSGLPALAVNWGPWDVGMIAQLGLQPFYQRRGIDLIPADTGMEILDELIGSSQTQQVVVSAHWPTLVASYPIVPKIIEHLARDEQTGDVGAGGQESLAERLAQAPADERHTVIEDGCAEVIGAVLRIKPDALARDVPLNQLGLDSMIAVEVRIRLEQAFGVAPKVVFLLQATTVARVAEFVEEKLAPPPAAEQPEDLAALLAALPPEAADVLLAQVERIGAKGSQP